MIGTNFPFSSIFTVGIGLSLQTPAKQIPFGHGVPSILKWVGCGHCSENPSQSVFAAHGLFVQGKPLGLINFLYWSQHFPMVHLLSKLTHIPDKQFPSGQGDPSSNGFF